MFHLCSRLSLLMVTWSGFEPGARIELFQHQSRPAATNSTCFTGWEFRGRIGLVVRGETAPTSQLHARMHGHMGGRPGLNEGRHRHVSRRGDKDVFHDFRSTPRVSMFRLERDARSMAK